MSNRYVQGILPLSALKNPEKYVGKLKNNIVFRSSLELSFLKWLDKNPSVIAFSSEEIIIPYVSPVDHRQHRYFMDFWMKYINNKGIIQEALVEIKPESQTKRPIIKESSNPKASMEKIKTYAINQAKWEAARAYGIQRNMIFRILTEKDLQGII